MGTEYQHFHAGEALYPTTNYPQQQIIQGTSFPLHVNSFDAATKETMFHEFIVDNYDSGNLSLDIYWYADNASSGDVIWGAQVACITPDTDTQDVETKSLATANTVTDSHLGTTNQRLHKATVTISNTDSIAAGDLVKVAIYRDAAAGGDTMSNDAHVWRCRISYTTA